MGKKIMQWIGVIVEFIGFILLLMDSDYGWICVFLGLVQIFLWTREENFSIVKYVSQKAAIFYIAGVLLIIAGMKFEGMLLIIGLFVIGIAIVCKFLRLLDKPCITITFTKNKKK